MARSVIACNKTTGWTSLQFRLLDASSLIAVGVNAHAQPRHPGKEKPRGPKPAGSDLWVRE